MNEVAHTPTQVTGTREIHGAEVTYDYMGCSVCRIDHPIIGPNIPQPWHKAHPDPLPGTASQVVRDGTAVRQ